MALDCPFGVPILLAVILSEAKDLAPECQARPKKGADSSPRLKPGFRMTAMTVLF